MTLRSPNETSSPRKPSNCSEDTGPKGRSQDNTSYMMPPSSPSPTPSSLLPGSQLSSPESVLLRSATATYLGLPSLEVGEKPTWTPQTNRGTAWWERESTWGASSGCCVSLGESLARSGYRLSLEELFVCSGLQLVSPSFSPPAPGAQVTYGFSLTVSGAHAGEGLGQG